MLKRNIAIVGASVILGAATVAQPSWADSRSTSKTAKTKKSGDIRKSKRSHRKRSSTNQQKYVAAEPSPSPQTVTATSDSSVQPSTSNTTPPGHLSSALGLGPTSRIHINGFLTAGAAWSDGSALYVVPNHGTIDNTIDAAPLSLIGLQFTADLARDLQVVTQLVGDGDNANGRVAYRVNVEWAFLRYSFNDNYQVMAGRFRLPAFLYAQTQQVGYSFPWVILPNEVYRIIPFENINGITFFTRHPLGNSGWNITSQSYYGSNRSQYTVYNTANPNGITVDFKENAMAGSVISIGNKNFTIRGTYATVKLTGTYEGVPPLIPQTTLFHKASSGFYSLGMKLLIWHIVLISEFADRKTPSNIASLEGYYGAIGYKIGKLLPLFTYARIVTTNTAALLARPALSESPQAQQSYTLSLTYTLNSNLDVKASASQISPLKGTFGLFTSDPRKRQVYLYGISLDAIF